MCCIEVSGIRDDIVSSLSPLFSHDTGESNTIIQCVRG